MVRDHPRSLRSPVKTGLLYFKGDPGEWMLTELQTACTSSDDQTDSGTLGIGIMENGVGGPLTNDPEKNHSDTSPKNQR